MMHCFVTLTLQVGFVVSAAIGAYADTGPPIPADLEFCASGSGHELQFDTEIKGVSDWVQSGPVSCIYQYSDMWHVLDCEKGRMLDIVTYRSEPTEWSAEPAVADVTEAAMTYREILVKGQMSVSFDVIRDDMRDLGAEVSERNLPNYRAICASS
jgi:hypothetical protein